MAMTTFETDDREWLEADGLGGFAMGTVAGERTRRYHGLLLTATTPPTGRMMLVNGFDAWLETATGRYAISSQRYASGGDGGASVVLPMARHGSNHSRTTPGRPGHFVWRTARGSRPSTNRATRHSSHVSGTTPRPASTTSSMSTMNAAASTPRAGRTRSSRSEDCPTRCSTASAPVSSSTRSNAAC
jgi:hypothetical protein